LFLAIVSRKREEKYSYKYLDEFAGCETVKVSKEKADRMPLESLGTSLCLTLWVRGIRSYLLDVVMPTVPCLELGEKQPDRQTFSGF